MTDKELVVNLSQIWYYAENKDADAKRLRRLRYNHIPRHEVIDGVVYVNIRTGGYCLLVPIKETEEEFNEKLKEFNNEV